MSVQNTLTQMQIDTAKVNFSKSQESTGSGKLDKDAFLRLLLAQLQHQDPMNPMEDTEFISQQAQFTQIEKMEQMNQLLSTSAQISQASSLVGKYVSIQRDDGSIAIGKVDSVLIGSDGVGVNVGEQTFGMDQVFKIYSDDPGVAQ